GPRLPQSLRDVRSLTSTFPLASVRASIRMIGSDFARPRRAATGSMFPFRASRPMAKKPPKPPTPPPDDFDEEIVPIEEVSADDLFGEVVADESDEATKTGHSPKGEVLPEVEVEAEEVVADAEADDLFANVAPDDEASATKTMHGAKNLDLPAVEV